MEVRKTRLNLKGKRKKNLVKKAIEVSTMLEMDVCIVMRCRDTGRVSLYQNDLPVGREGPQNNQASFTIQKA